MTPVISSEAGTQCSIHVPSLVMDEAGNKVEFSNMEIARAATPSVGVLSSVLTELCREIDTCRVRVETMFSLAEKRSVEDGTGSSRNAIVQHFRNMNFIDTLVKPYLAAFDKLNVQNRRQVEDLYKRHGMSEGQQLERAEMSWDHLLKVIDLSLSTQSKSRTAKEDFEYEKLRLIDCDTEREITLNSCLNHKYGNFTLFVLVRFYGCRVSERYVLDLYSQLREFHQRLCNVVVVCKGTKEGGKKWRQLIGLNLPVLADERGEFIAAFHFPMSLWNMCRTSERCSLASAMKLNDISLLDDAQKDLYQLGGEVLLNNRGRMLYIHKCQTTEDRPVWRELLTVIDEKTRGGRGGSSNGGQSAQALRKEDGQAKNSKTCLLM